MEAMVTSQTDDSSIFQTGSMIDGKWMLMERIGKGGMGEVYRAHQLNLKRDVALKLISEDLLQELEENPQEVETAFSRFHREVQTMAQVRHPNVVQIYDYGSVTVRRNGQPMPMEYIAMEYIPGDTLRFTMSEEGFGEEEDLLVEWLQHYFLPVLDGVEAIHNHGIVHRDFKPENILMDGETPKIADFGLARAVRLKAVSNSWDVKGTWPYMAPEQYFDFRRAGREADIYALGKILFEAISGKLDAKRLPFKSAALEDPRTSLLKALDVVIRKATSEDKHQRYQSIDEMRRAVRQALETNENAAAMDTVPSAAPAAVRWLWGGIAVALLAVASMTAYHLWNRALLPQPSRDQPGVNAPVAPGPGDSPATLTPDKLAADGRTMILVPETLQTAAFYADPTLVTFHHYVEFLNAVADELTVTNGVVQKDDEIWIYLGDGSDPQEQIIFNNGRFQLREAENAARPVARVTWWGAQAYSRYFNKQLPDLAQLEALTKQHPQSVKPETTAPSQGHEHMKSSIDGAEDLSLSGTGGVTREWLADQQPEDENRVISRVVQWNAGGSEKTPLLRQPWEAFDDVGFRTIMQLTQIK